MRRSATPDGNSHSDVLSVIYGIPPAEILDECRKHAIRAIGTTTTPEEAIALEAAGLDFIVASGFEAGGHRGSFLRPAAHSLMGAFRSFLRWWTLFQFR